MRRFWRSAAECLVASLVLASISAIYYRLHLNVATAALLFVIVIVIISRFGSFVSSVFAAIIAGLCLILIVPPVFSFKIHFPLDIVAIVTFLVTSLVIAGLVSQERKRAEVARLSHAAIVESSDDAIICKNLDAVITSWNAGAERLFGYTEAEVLGRPITIIIPPEFRGEENKILKRLRAGGRIEHYETKRLTKAGNRVDVSLIIVPVKDSTGRIVGFSKIAHDITPRKQAEKTLQESERRFRLVADTAPVLIWMSGTDKLCTYFNKPWLDFTGRSLEQEIGNGWVEAVHLDDLKSCLQTYTESFDRREKFRMEYRLRSNDGQYRWILDIGVPRFNEDGSFAGYIGSCIDVTDQKMAQESLEKVSGQLIAAHEVERSHLARELHDDICQRLAILSLRIEKATKGFGSPQKSTAEQLEQIWQQCSSLTADVQALSHELHPSTLDNLGLVAAVRRFCREVSEQNGTVVEFAETDISSSLPREVSLALFRVIQEALHNAAKYSGQKHFKVLLKGNVNQIELEVSDQGAGFDLESMKNGRGLGLVSMAERIHLLNGRISIDSKPNVGTTVRAWVPLATQPKAVTASAN